MRCSGSVFMRSLFSSDKLLDCATVYSAHFQWNSSMLCWSRKQRFYAQKDSLSFLILCCPATKNWADEKKRWDKKTSHWVSQSESKNDNSFVIAEKFSLRSSMEKIFSHLLPSVGEWGEFFPLSLLSIDLSVWVSLATKIWFSLGQLPEREAMLGHVTGPKQSLARTLNGWERRRNAP